MTARERRPRSRKGAPGIVEVARRAGVSPATVSRCFNNPDMVRPDTRANIERAANALGYIRDRMAGTLHNRFSGTIGLVVPTIDNAIFAELIEAFSNRLLKHDRNMLLASHNYHLEREVSIIRSLLERRIDGLAIIGHDHPPAALEMLRVRGVPVVALWNYRSRATIPFIGADNTEAARRVTQHLLDLGHHDIAFLFPDTHANDRARDRKLGAFETMRRAGFDIPEHRQILCDYQISAAKDEVSRLIKDDKPTALVCGNDVIAHGAIYATAGAGLVLPRDLSIVGIGDFRGSAQIEPGLTTVRLPAKRIGIMAAERLVQMNEQRRDDVRALSDAAEDEEVLRASTITSSMENICVEAELVIRASTGKPAR